MPVIIGPSPHERVELPEERLLSEAQGGFDADADFLTQGFDVRQSETIT